MFKKASKQQSKLRMAIHGPAGAGKTYSALNIAKYLGSKVALVDTEKGSASLYSDQFDFDVVEVEGDYNPGKIAGYIEAAKGYDVLVIDSMSHFWNSTGGFLQLVDEEVKKMKARGQAPDSFGAWKTIDPVYRRMVDAMLQAPQHIIFTLRAKMSYEKQQNDKGRTEIKKMGMAPQMRDDFQYEFGVEGMLTMEHDLVIGKTRFNTLDGRVFHKPGKEFAETILADLNQGSDKPVESKPGVVIETKDYISLIGELPYEEAVAKYREIKSKLDAGTSQVIKDNLLVRKAAGNV